MYECIYCKKQIIGFNCDCQGNKKLWNTSLRGARLNQKKRHRLSQKIN